LLTLTLGRRKAFFNADNRIFILIFKYLILNKIKFILSVALSKSGGSAAQHADARKKTPVFVYAWKLQDFHVFLRNGKNNLSTKPPHQKLAGAY
ncbi:MAG: hypothetical protein LBH84_03235, partial [Prevotellaceae bacterium]|nr:hypothetical protein [Prevotellaceae bacterium]